MNIYGRENLAFSYTAHKDQDETLSGNEKQLLKMLTILENKRAQLEQQKNDIAQAEMEMDTAEARCREALAELQKKKKQQAPANDEARQTAEN